MTKHDEILVDLIRRYLKQYFFVGDVQINNGEVVLYLNLYSTLKDIIFLENNIIPEIQKLFNTEKVVYVSPFFKEMETFFQRNGKV